MVAGRWATDHSRAGPEAALRRRIVVTGAASFVLYATLAAVGDLRAHLALYLGVHGGLFAVYAGIVLAVVREHGPEERRPASPRSRTRERAPGPPPRVPAFGAEVLDPRAGGRDEVSVTARVVRLLARPEAAMAFFALAFRLVLVPVPASLSDDLYRYLWDGRVQAHGINPYLHAPESDELRALRDAGWARINHREIPTIYPPLLEGAFLAVTAAGLGEVGFKTLVCLVDLAVVLALARLLRKSGAGALLAIAYAWNPLVVVEVASSGHADPIGLLLLVLAVVFVLQGQHACSMVSWAASVLARWLPVAFVPIFARKARWRHLAVALGFTIVGFVPYAGAGRRLFAGLRAYAENWDHNSIVFPATRWLLEATVPVEALEGAVTRLEEALHDPEWCQALYRAVWPASLARLLLAGVFAAAVTVIAFRVRETPRALFWAAGWMLVLTPTLHPWYLLWILPFAALEVSWPWILMTGLAPLSYLSLRTADGRVPLAILLLEWGAPALLALVLWVRRRDPGG